MSASPSPLGIIAPPTLNGVHLRLSPNDTRVTVTEVKSLRETASGGRVEQRAWWGQVALERPELLLPTRKLKHQVSLEYQHLRQYDLIEELLAAPAPHSLSIWKPVTLTYTTDGVRGEGWLPWRLAVDSVGAPLSFTAERFDPIVKIERTSVPLAVVLQDAAAYAADPPPGEVWFLEGDQVFKLAAPPSEALVYVRFWPLLQVFEENQVDRDYNNQTLFREPRSIDLIER